MAGDRAADMCTAGECNALHVPLCAGAAVGSFTAAAADVCAAHPALPAPAHQLPLPGERPRAPVPSKLLCAIRCSWRCQSGVLRISCLGTGSRLGPSDFAHLPNTSLALVVTPFQRVGLCGHLDLFTQERGLSSQV